VPLLAEPLKETTPFTACSHIRAAPLGAQQE